MKLVQIGDELYDEETGEFAGLACAWLPNGPLESETDLHNFLQRRSELETELAAAEMQYASVLSNITKIIKKRQQRLDWLNARYESSATAVAETLLPRKPDGTVTSKTWTSPWGQVKFRDKPASVKIADPELALRFAEQFAPDAIKRTESVLVSKLPTSDWLDEGRTPDGFTISPRETTVSITTLDRKEKNGE